VNARNDLIHLELRPPVAADGYPLNKLVAASPPLDTNSVYCNLLQTSQFAETSVAACHKGELVGYISAYIPPSEPDTLFVWQVVVAEQARGQGLAKRMLRYLVDLPACAKLSSLTTTITQDNKASWALFESLGRDFGAAPTNSLLFERDTHFAGQHDGEYLVRIAPLPQVTKPMHFHLDELRSGMRNPCGKRWLD
jgi:L-2,4-diaminobutyric acid acetyltransferase